MGIRILLIDDNPFDRELVRRGLRGLPTPPGPVELVGVGEWAEARPHLDAGGFDLLLLDYHLPGVTGLDVLRELRGRVHPPIVMMTGQDDIATAVETLRAGAESRARLAVYAAELEQKVAARTAVVRAQAAEIEALYLRAEEAARLKEEIVANVSHEFRTPLNVILGYTDLLGERLPKEGGEAGEMLAKVRGQAERLRELVESLLALRNVDAGGEGVVPSSFTLADFMEELRAEALRLSTDRALSFNWKVPPEPCEVEHDREKVRAIAYHLLTNAIKFTPSGEIEVAATRTADGGIILTVRDTGIGVPPEARAVIFDDFRQLDGSSTRRYEGMGLGLGIVRRYTALLQGALRLDSTPGEGSCFRIILPVRPAPERR